MINPLIDHAIRNVWCTPDQDKQVIIKTARLSKINGVWKNITVSHRNINLPNQTDRFHVYQIGRLHPGIIGLFDSDGKWEKFSDCCIRQTMLINVYVNNGLQIPLSHCWYKITSDRNFIIAVKEQKKLDYDFNTPDVFFRMYTNDWFTSNENVAIDKVDVQGGVILAPEDLLPIQTAYQNYLNQPGSVLAYVNGRLKNTLSLINVQMGDVVEFIYDSSVLKTVDILIGDLQTFTSDLDSKYKYLIHDDQLTSDSIQFYDDIDFYIINKNGANVDGLYYHRNNEDAVRMITHCDYSLVVSYIDAIRSTNPAWTNINSLYVRAIVRKTGYDRTIVNDSNRIKELYKLPKAKRLQSMLGVNSVVSNWTVDNLEGSAYSEIMRSKINEISVEKMEQAYGYNAISKILADTPKHLRMFSGKKIITLPHGLIDNSTIYEYDENGHLLDYHHHSHGYHYVASSPNAVLVEGIVGIGTDQLDDIYGQVMQPISPRYDYRMYICNWLNGEPDNKWVDVTNSGLYTIVNGTLTWLIDTNVFFTCVRSNRNFLAYDIETIALDGVIRFSLDQVMTRDSVTDTWVMQIPMGELDIFMNNRSLIEGIDYIVRFPEIVIISKNHLSHPVQSGKQKISIRYTGFCKPDMLHAKAPEYGFVDHLLLSNNSKFDIRDDKVMRIIVNGSLKHRDQLLFAENDQGVTSIDNRNGDPYLVRDIVVPTRGYTNTKTYQLRELALQTDKRVSDYMSLWIPKPTFPGPNIINERYPVYSPFCSMIIFEMIRGNLDDDRMYQYYNDETVMDICSRFEYLLKYDPTQEENRLDSAYVIIHPHISNVVLGLTLHQFNFLKRVVSIYLKNKVQLNHFVTVTP